MDNASDYGSEDSRFESWQARFFARSFNDASIGSPLSHILDELTHVHACNPAGKHDVWTPNSLAWW